MSSSEKKPVSEKQLAANRANAAKSTGPTSATGKGHSSQNARKPWFLLRQIHRCAPRRYPRSRTPSRRPDRYLPARQFPGTVRPRAHGHMPAGHAPRRPPGKRPFHVVHERVVWPEGAPSLPFRQEMAAGIEITRELNRNFILADGFQLLVRQGNSIPLFLRYQAQVERLYRRAVEEFERVKKLRPELPNEPIFEDDEPLGDSPEPQPDEPVPAPDAAPVPPAPNEPISAPDPQPLDPILPAALAWPPVCKKQRLTKRATSNYLGRSSRRTSPRTVRRIAKGANSRVEIGNDSNLAGASRHGRRGR